MITGLKGAVLRPCRIALPAALGLLLLLFCGPLSLRAEEAGIHEARAGLIDLRTTWSDGRHGMEELVRLARSRGFRILFITDHDRIDLAYGLPPFRNLLRYKKSLPSIMSRGPEKYLARLEEVSRKYPDMILIPGCETSAYYYWSGSWFQRNLTLHEYDRRILVLNFNRPRDYAGIPNLGNRLSLAYTLERLPGLALFVLPLLMGAVMMRWKGFSRIMGGGILVLSLLALMDYNPFRSSPFSAYKGDQGIAPFQEIIDYVHERGGFSFWNYPEQRSGIRKHGPILVNTPPYPRVLQQSRGYTGFAAIYGDRITLTEPGQVWDQVLEEYCRGSRKNAPWAIATADFHEEGRLGLKLGAFPTTFLLKAFSKAGVLEALEKGRMYCSRGDGRLWPKLERFQVTEKGGRSALMGETLQTTHPPEIRFRVSYGSGDPRPMTLRLIRGGEVIKTFRGETPLKAAFVDRGAPSGEKTFYRLMDARKHLTSNPIFVTYAPP